MVPLERVLTKPASDPSPVRVLPQPKPRPAPAPEPRMPRRFKVVDVMTREVLAEDVDTRTTVKLLDGVRSIVDVTIFVWQPEDERWRMLTLDDTRSLWRYRGAVHDTAAQPG
jgi:hypothetical protein